MNLFVYSINTVLVGSLVWEEGLAENELAGKNVVRTQTEAVRKGGLVVFHALLGFAQRNETNSFYYDLYPLQ